MNDIPLDQLVPHSGTMSLLDSVTDSGNDWLTAKVTITKDSLFCDERGVPAYIGLEYLAQAIAAFSGIKQYNNNSQPKLGFLLGTRKYSCNKDYFAIGQTLIITVHCEMQADNGLNAFQGTLEAENIKASARLNVFQPDNAEHFIKDTLL